MTKLDRDTVMTIRALAARGWLIERIVLETGVDRRAAREVILTKHETQMAQPPTRMERVNQTDPGD